MTTVNITISIGTDGFYCAQCADYPALFGGGVAPETAIEELRETLRITREDGREKAFIYPDWLDDDYELTPTWDVESFLRYYSGIITPTALGKLSGIHPKQLWSYMHGRSKPRQTQIDRIQEAVHQLGRQLMEVSF